MRIFQIILGIVILLWAIVLPSCDPCRQYENEIYTKDDSEKKISLEFFNKEMKSYEEPELSNLNCEAFRFTYTVLIRNYTSGIIRIEKKKNVVLIIVKKLVSKGDYQKEVAETIEKRISVQNWNDLLNSIYRTRYWTLHKKLESDEGYLDGTWWTIEGRRPQAEVCGKRSYHIIARLGHEDGDVADLLEKIVQIAEVNNIDLFDNEPRQQKHSAF